MGSGDEIRPEDVRGLKAGDVARKCGKGVWGGRKGGKRLGSGDVG